MKERVGVTIMRGDEPAFDLILYGVTMKQVCTVPTGGALVQRALRRMRLDPADFWSSPFLCYPYPHKPVTQ